MNTILTSEEKYELRRMHRSIKNRRDADKIKAVLMFADGYTLSEIAKVLLIDNDTVQTWINAYKNNTSIDSLFETNYVAYQGKLSKEEMVKVDAMW